MIKRIIILILIPVSVYCRNIGLCGGKLFPQRQKLINNLVLKLSGDAAEKNQKRIIDEYGYIGIENLIRYKDKNVEKIILKLLNHENFYVKYKSLYGLRNFPDTHHDVIYPFLSSTNLYLQDMAVSTLTEIGTEKDIPYLKETYSKTTNACIKSSIQYALEKITNKKKVLFQNFNFGLENKNPKRYRYYKVGEKIEGYMERFSQIQFRNILPPAADSFIPPVINYWTDFHIKGKRMSFGAGGGYRRHVGDDCGWFREGSSVYAMADGVIRIIHHSPDWGFLIVIEHIQLDGKYICSVYGHLSKEIYKKAGEIVKKGEKIGTIGLSYSVENGGYGAHLHFGISKGPWLKSRFYQGQNLTLMMDDKEQKVIEYRITEKGTELIFDSGIKITLSDNQKRHSNKDSHGLFWLKGYEFAQDVDRYWIDPQEFLKQ